VQLTVVVGTAEDRVTDLAAFPWNRRSILFLKEMGISVVTEQGCMKLSRLRFVPFQSDRLITGLFSYLVPTLSSRDSY